MLVLPGSSAITKPRRDVLLTQLQAVIPSIQAVDAAWLHLIEETSSQSEPSLHDPSSTARSSLDRLLDYGDDVFLPNTAAALKSKRNLLYVLPRPGSISPWSSKATDIALLCQLGDHVKRLERGVVYTITFSDPDHILSSSEVHVSSHLLHDRMTQSISFTLPNESDIFAHAQPRPLRTIDVLPSQSLTVSSQEALKEANRDLGLALSQHEIGYLADAYVSGPNPMNRNPTDAELFMFAQVNSEHCRHKIFNASWAIDGVEQDNSLFQMIRNTERISPGSTISAYSDNAAVLGGSKAPRFSVQSDHLYHANIEEMPILIKVETHNHPTAVSPYPGAATGSGGEIRDEGAVGRGSKPKAGLAGFTVSNLLIPDFKQEWETDYGRPSHIASALDIMLEAPLGASAFNNEFGRPALAGYFRTFAEEVPTPGNGKEIRGYHKPIMIAGGYGNVRPQFSRKTSISPGARIVVLGGPGLLIGLGGGAASSQISGAGSAELDFASVQRDNAEMQRRCQQVIDACISLDSDTALENPIQSIHDVGAGGLSNALPELVHDSGLGATFEIRDVLVADASMSPMEIWCNESQERYVLAISPSPGQFERFENLARRERCPFSAVGIATTEETLIVTDRLFKRDVINLKMSTLFGKPPRMHRIDNKRRQQLPSFDSSLKTYTGAPSVKDALAVAVERILRLPSVASKSFLITIGDRSISGLVTRDQMVGPFQVPVADVAVTRSSYGFDVVRGEAMAMGERTPLALISAAASARMAVGESLTNLVAASIDDISLVKLSANWMCATSKAGEGAGLYEAVSAIGIDLCPKLGIGIPVGKDSMSMSMKWQQNGKEVAVSSPLSLIVTAFAPVNDVGKTWTPQIRADVNEKTLLIFFDLAAGEQRLGGSALAQTMKQIGSVAPDVNAELLKAFFQGCQQTRRERPHLVLAYHDRSDGGLFTTLAEMAFAGHVGIDVSLPDSYDPIPALFNEELGAVMQVREADVDSLKEIFSGVGFPASLIHVIGRLNKDEASLFRVLRGDSIVFASTRKELQLIWSETSYRMQALRDNPATSREEHDLVGDPSHKGLFYDLSFTHAPRPLPTLRPKVAILREQGVNGHVELAWAFTAAGFDAIDVHMSDILGGKTKLSNFRGLAAGGGFSYGDVLGAGKGWANSVLLNTTARKEFVEFFERNDTFTLAICNGCQFLSRLRDIIPGASAWPDFKPNLSERFEARVCMVEIMDSPCTRSSVFLRDMSGSKLPVAVAHGEGRAAFPDAKAVASLGNDGLVGIRYVDSSGAPTEVYPLNPNGSPAGITGVQNQDGRVLALMPHPERVVALESNSWFPPAFAERWQGVGPWFQLFQSARSWCEERR